MYTVKGVCGRRLFSMENSEGVSFLTFSVTWGSNHRTRASKREVATHPDALPWRVTLEIFVELGLFLK